VLARREKLTPPRARREPDLKGTRNGFMRP
jgi:hypothetical protein